MTQHVLASQGREWGLGRTFRWSWPHLKTQKVNLTSFRE